MGGLGCVSMVQIAILVAATVRGRLTMRVLEEAAEVGAPKQVAQLSQRWRAAMSGPMPTPPAPSLLPPSSPPPLPAFAARSGGPALRSSAAPASRTPAPLPGTIRSDPMGRAPAAALPSDASIEEPASNRPTNSSSSGGKGGQGGKGGRGSKGGKGAAAKGAHTKRAKAKGGDMLISQEYGGVEEWRGHFEYLLPFFQVRAARPDPTPELEVGMCAKPHPFALTSTPTTFASTASLLSPSTALASLRRRAP